MEDLLYRNKYRIPSIRFPDWDYSVGGFYFITVCTKTGKYYFGEIENEIMCLYRTGSIAWSAWLDIVNHFHHVYLDEFVVMPNHIHCVIKIDHGQATCFDDCVECKMWWKKRYDVSMLSTDGGELPNIILPTMPVETLQCNVSTRQNPPTFASYIPRNVPSSEFMSSISPTAGSIPTIVRSYKSAVTKQINQLFKQHNVKQKFVWQPRFYDRIIRSERELYYVREYIKNNPVKWWRDRNNQVGILM